MVRGALVAADAANDFRFLCVMRAPPTTACYRHCSDVTYSSNGYRRMWIPCSCCMRPFPSSHNHRVATSIRFLNGAGAVWTAVLLAGVRTCEIPDALA